MRTYANPATAGGRQSSAAPRVFSAHLRRVRLSYLSSLFRLWRRRIRTRRALAELDERDLHDIGRTPAEARYESEQPFWKPWSGLWR